MRPLEETEKRQLYRISKILLTLGGFALFGYGSWLMVSQYLSEPSNLGYWVGIFPAYIGAMMVLLALAMKEDWFTNARKYW